jgi:hypothetical protein
LRRLLLAAGLGVGLAGPCFADPAITTATSAMRHSPSLHSRIVQTIPANAEIDLQNCARDWCYVSWRNIFGYIPSFAVAQGGPPPGVVAPAESVVVAPPPVVVGPAFVWGGPYIGGYWGRW